MTVKKIISYKHGLLIYCFFIIFLNILLTQLPLTSTFGYEFAAINGLILSILAGLYTFNFVNISEFSIKELAKSLFIFFLIPFAISVINSILTMFCSFIDGLLFYILIVTASILFGMALASVVSLITKKFSKLIFTISIILFAFIPILEIYFNPQVYFYSPLIGFFPGNIYDEGLSPEWKLFFHQLLVIISSLSVIFVIIKKNNLVKRFKTHFLITIVFLISLFQFLSTHLRFSTTFATLDSILSKKIESESFILHYDNIDSTEATHIALNQEFYYFQLYTALKIKPTKKINVYLYNDREQKKELFGAGNADVAKPWQYSIFISADSWQNTLKHELAHVFTAEFGSGIFKLASGFNAALIEGMAESLDGISDDISISNLTSLAYNNGYVLDIQSLFSGLSFFKGNSSLAYTYSGTFMQYLTQKYGIEKVKEFYNNGEYELIFKNKIEVSQKDFERSITNPELSNQKPMADYYFGRLSLVQKICPRYVGDRLAKAYQKLSENKFYEAEKLFQEISTKTLNYSSIIVLSEIYYQQNKKDQAIQLVLSKYEKFKSTPYMYNLIFRLAELYALNHNNDSALYWYNKIISENPNYQLCYLSNTRISLLKVGKLYEYIGGSDSLKLEILIDLNEQEYNYHSIPIIVDLLRNRKIDYKNSLRIFNKTFIVDNLKSSYAAFKLSQFMIENSDYSNTRKYAALSLRFKERNMFYSAMLNQFEKANWFYRNSNLFMDKFVYVSN